MALAVLRVGTRGAGARRWAAGVGAGSGCSRVLGSGPAGPGPAGVRGGLSTRPAGLAGPGPEVVACSSQRPVDGFRSQLRTGRSAARGAQRGQVGEAPEGQHQAEDTQPRGDRDRDDAEQRADDPRGLEAGLEAGERPAPYRVGTIALQQAVEGQAPSRGTDPDRQGGDRQTPGRAQQRPEQRRGCAGQQGANQNRFLAKVLAESRRKEVADEVARPRASDHETESDNMALERERGEEDQESHRAAQQRHRRPGNQDRWLMQLLAFPLGLVGRDDHLGTRDPCREDGRHHEHDHRQPQRPVGAEQPDDGDRRCPADGRGAEADELQPRVGPHELVLILDESRDQRAARDPVPLREDEDPERERVDEQALGRRLRDHLGHEQAQRGPADAGDDHEHAPPSSQAVEGGADHRGDHREGGHGDEQVEQDRPPGAAARLREEDRPRQGDRHARVGAHRHGVRPHEPPEWRQRQEARILTHRQTWTVAAGPPDIAGHRATPSTHQSWRRAPTVHRRVTCWYTSSIRPDEPRDPPLRCDAWPSRAGRPFPSAVTMGTPTAF